MKVLKQKLIWQTQYSFYAVFSSATLSRLQRNIAISSKSHSRIRSRNPSKRQTADPRYRPRGHCNQPSLLYNTKQLYRSFQNLYRPATHPIRHLILFLNNNLFYHLHIHFALNGYSKTYLQIHSLQFYRIRLHCKWSTPYMETDCIWCRP